MFSHPELGSDPPIGSGRESGCDTLPNDHKDGINQTESVINVI